MIVYEHKSNFELLREFFSIQDVTITPNSAAKQYSDSKLLAVLIADPRTFSKWLAEARDWCTKK